MRSPVVLRNLLRAPLFCLVVILTLGVAIGANSAIFSLVDALLIRPLPYPESERLVGVWHTAPAIDVPQFEQADGTYLIYRERNRVFEEMGVYRGGAVNLGGNPAPEEVSSARITPSILSTLRVFPALGRGFAEEEGLPGAEPTVILSHGLWSTRFAADPEVLGRQVRIEGVPHTVIGVMPAGFHFPERETRLWRPLAIDPARADTGNFLYSGIARLKPGIEPSAAAADISALVKILPEEAANPHMSAEMIENIGMAALVTPLRDDIVGDISGALRVLLGSAGVILLIACANLANLFLVRAEGRYREMAVRSALGASRGAIARIFLGESVLLALVGGSLGLWLASSVLDALAVVEMPGVPRLAEVAISGNVILFTLAISLLSGLLFGAIPALRGVTGLGAALKETGRATSGRSRHRARNALVVAQIALALILLTGSGLMATSLRELFRVDPGFASSRVLTLRLSPPAADYPQGSDVAAFSGELLEVVRAVPGVISAATVNLLPVAEQAPLNTHVFEEFPPEEGELPPFHPVRMVSPAYFETMEIPVMEGRVFERADIEQPAGAIVISAALARHYWPGESALGKRLRPETTAPGDWHTVVGIVGDTRDELQKPPAQSVYYPLVSRSKPEGREIRELRGLSLVVRSSLSPVSLVDSIRAAVTSVDPSVAISRVRSMEDVLAAASAGSAFMTMLLAVAAGLALSLGAVGLYGVISYVVSQRTHEIGIRMALGADRARVTWMVLRQGLGVAAIGIVLGLAGALGVTRELESLLFAVSPTDPLTFVIVPFIVLAVALLASYLPAQRAAAIDPLAALRHE